MELNYISEGTYKYWHLKRKLNGDVYLVNNWATQKILLDSNSVASIMPVSNSTETKTTPPKGRLAKAAVGGALFGVGGAIVGATSGTTKSKTVASSYNVVIIMNDGTKAVVEVDKDMFNALMSI